MKERGQVGDGLDSAPEFSADAILESSSGKEIIIDGGVKGAVVRWPR